MRGFVVSSGLLVLVIVIFLIGLFGAAPGLSMIGFCMSPIIMFAMGWTASRAFAGRKLALVETLPPSRRQVGQQKVVRGRMEEGL